MATLIEIVKECAENLDSSIGTYNDDLDYVTEDFCTEVMSIAFNAELNVNYEYGATQLCFIDENNHDYIIKMPFVNKSWSVWGEDEDGNEYEREMNEEYSQDYTAECANIYEEAIDAGVAMFFARVEPVCNGVWKQEFVIAREKGSSPRINKISDEEINKIVKLSLKNNWRFDKTWIADCIFYYGIELFDRFIKFIKQQNINDLHNGNYGWTKNGYPRLLDYSGYKEE